MLNKSGGNCDEICYESIYKKVSDRCKIKKENQKPKKYERFIYRLISSNATIIKRGIDCILNKRFHLLSIFICIPQLLKQDLKRTQDFSIPY